MILDPLGAAGPKIRAVVPETSPMGERIREGLLDLSSVELDLQDVGEIVADIARHDVDYERLDALHRKLHDLTLHASGAILAVGMARFAQKKREGR